MSKHDITTVCTLAAHLAQRLEQCPDCCGGGVTDNHVTGKVECGSCGGSGCFAVPLSVPSQCASDAMKLQRLGRRTRNLFKKLEGVWAFRLELGVLEKGRIEEAGNTLLNPYGLSCHVSGEYPGFYIKGLPANTESAIEEFLL